MPDQERIETTMETNIYDDMMEEPHGSMMRNALLCFFFGAAIGATAGVLCAPASGAETRANLGNKAHDLKDKAIDFKVHAAEKLDEWKGKATNRVAAALDTASDRIQDARDIVSYSQTTGSYGA
jgi:gas vesicle protein